MGTIATLTLNPAIDASYEVDQLVPVHKMRAHDEQHDPGGGGINVARVIAQLGGDACAYYLAGGGTGAALDALLDGYAVPRVRLNVAGDSRICTTIHERRSGLEYRFVPPGPTISEGEWTRLLTMLETVDCTWLVASGSLPHGVPLDFYARAHAIAKRRNIAFVLDSSGEALRQGLTGGDIFLLKPSIGELESLTGRDLSDAQALKEAAASLVTGGVARHVAVSLGEDGALLADASGIIQLPAIPVEALSGVGAGDSFVGAMVLALSQGWAAPDAFRFGLAAGAAAVALPGTKLCERADTARLYATVRRQGAPEYPVD